MKAVATRGSRWWLHAGKSAASVRVVFGQDQRNTEIRRKGVLGPRGGVELSDCQRGEQLPYSVPMERRTEGARAWRCVH